MAKSKDRWRPSIAIRYLDDLPGIDVGMYIGFKRSLMVHSPLGSHILPLVSQPAAQLTTSTGPFVGTANFSDLCRISQVLDTCILSGRYAASYVPGP